MNQAEQIRIRAPRACQRCSKRKTKCDAAEMGLPCSRCKQDQRANCMFTPSRRGTYDRSRVLSRKKAPMNSWEVLLCENGPSSPENRRSAADSIEVSSTSDTLAVHNEVHNEVQNPISVDTPIMPNVFSSNTPLPENLTHRPMISRSASPTSRQRQHVDFLPGVEIYRPRSAMHGSTTPRGIPGRSSLNAVSSSEARQSLAAAFEDFLDEHGYGGDALDKCGIIFLNEASPLTFALEELRRPKGESLHDVGSSLSKHISDGTGNAAPNAILHPSHLPTATYTYLNDHGAFVFPSAELLSSLMTAFLDHFLPVYPIVDRKDFVHRYEQQKLPWILMHAVCFVGATFCDQNVLHQAGFRRRWHARRSFYDKAKILFDTGYETNKVTLLQTVLMLTFWGPQMRSYWNPCSWVGFAVTIAESLGINQSVAIARMNPDDKSLLRRLWWILVLRDASCASFLGRPFRINLSQCDMEPLNMNDFSSESSNVELNTQVQALYQIKVVELSMLLRDITAYRSKKDKSAADTGDLFGKLQKWKADLPDVLNWNAMAASGVFSSSLKIIFYHHIILIYLEPSTKPDQTGEADYLAVQRVRDAASIISASALSLVTHSMLDRLPHEVFTAFSVAGIVFYRQIIRSDDMMAEIGRATLDNCRMIISEACDQWDAGPWMLRVFDFLLSNTSRKENAMSLTGPTEPHQPTHTMISHDGPNITDSSLDAADVLHSIDWESPQFQQLARTFNDGLLLPVFDNPEDFFWTRS